MAIGLNQVEKNLLGQFAVARSARRQKKQRIFLANWVRFFDFAKQLASIFKLRLELGAHFGANVVAATVNSGADGSPEIAGRGAEPAPHLAHALLHDAFDSSTPARMEYADGTASGVHQDYGQTIGGQNCQQNSWGLSDQAVTGERRFRKLGNAMNKVRETLAQGDQRPDPALRHGSEA